MGVSKRGFASALRAASIPALSPFASPIAIKADPALLIMDLTSAKSMLINPGLVIISEIPWTPWRKTSSASLKA